MKKNFKYIFLILSLFFVFSMSFTYASNASEETVIKNILSSILNILSWFAYAIALGMIIFIGIKYVTSGANERANLKGMIPKYLIGVALIVMCFTIASYVAEIAGNDTAEEIIDVGAGDAEIGGSNNNNNN